MLNRKNKKLITALSFQKSKGFTLIEVLVAIAVFASLSFAAYQVVNQIQRSNELSLEKSEGIEQLQRTLIYMDNDFRQITSRKFRTEGEAPSKQVLFVDESLLDSEFQGIFFVRLGWGNPQEIFPRGEVTKVGYRVIDGELERLWWRYPDTIIGEEPVIKTLIAGVENLSFEFYENGNWKKELKETEDLPRAIKVILNFEDYGEIERIYLLPSGKGYSNEEES